MGRSAHDHTVRAAFRVSRTIDARVLDDDQVHALLRWRIATDSKKGIKWTRQRRRRTFRQLVDARDTLVGVDEDATSRLLHSDPTAIRAIIHSSHGENGSCAKCCEEKHDKTNPSRTVAKHAAAGV